MKLKKLLSAILAGATVLCTTALPAFAGDAETGSSEPATVAAIGNTAYSTFEKAVTAAKGEDDTYTVKEKTDVTLFDKIAVLRGKEPWLFAGIDTLNYDKAGFKFTIGNDEFELPESVVCQEVTCGTKKITASDLGGSYIFGVKLDERFKAAFTAAPFADGQEGTATKFDNYVAPSAGDSGTWDY